MNHASSWYEVETVLPFSLPDCFNCKSHAKGGRKKAGGKCVKTNERPLPCFLASPICFESRCRRKLPSSLRPSVTDVCVERVPYRVQITHLVKARTSKHDDMEVHCLLGFSPFEGLG